MPGFIGLFKRGLGRVPDRVAGFRGLFKWGLGRTPDSRTGFRGLFKWGLSRTPTTPEPEPEPPPVLVGPASAPIRQSVRKTFTGRGEAVIEFSAAGQGRFIPVVSARGGTSFEFTASGTAKVDNSRIEAEALALVLLTLD